MNRDVRSPEDLLRLLDGLFPPEGDRWDGFYADRDRDVPFFVDKPDENLVSWVSRGLIRPGRALDVGCGVGRNALYLASQGFDVDAVDLSPTAIGQARERAGGARVRFHRANIFELTLDHGVDLVYDSGCFHHLAPHRRMGYPDFLRRALLPGGHFGLVCFGSGGTALSDAEVYRQASTGGGLSYTEESIRGIFRDFAEIEQREMIEQGDESPLFGRSFLRTALFRFEGFRQAAEARATVLRGLVTVADRRHELIDALWETTDPTEMQEAVERVLGVSSLQARAVLDLQLRRLTPWQMAMLREELERMDE